MRLRTLLLLLCVLCFPIAAPCSLEEEDPYLWPEIQSYLKQADIAYFHPLITFMVSPFYANEPLEHLKDRLTSAGRFISPETRHKTATGLIDIYTRLGSKKPKKCAAIWCDNSTLLPFLAAKRNIIELVVMRLYDNSPEAEEFLLARLSDSEPQIFDITKGAIYHSKQKSDKIYDKITELSKTGKLEEDSALILKMRINYDRALPEIRKALATTTDEKKFRSLVSELGYKKDSTMLDLIFERCPQFSNLGFIVRGIDSGVLDHYLITSEGDRFKKALTIISKEGIDYFHRKDEMLFYRTKLESKKPTTRSITIEHIGKVKIPAAFEEIKWRKRTSKMEPLVRLLEEAQKTENDAKIKTEISTVLKNTAEELTKRGVSLK